MDILKLDKWQQEVMNHEGNLTIRAGRQVGKSTVIAKKAANFAESKPGTTTLVIAAAQRQSSLLFEKIKYEIDEKVRKGQLEYTEKPTLTRMKVSRPGKGDKTQIYSLPAGRTGWFIRGFTVDLLIADEAAFIPEEVWKSVIPMIAVSKQLRKLGWIILLSTPFGKGGYFYETHHDQEFRKFHISSERCPRIPRSFLQKEKRRMTKAEYAQEYLGEFIDEWNQFFPTELIKKCMTFITWSKERDYNPRNSYYMGVDIARYGGDENAFVLSEMDMHNNIKVVRVVTTSRVSTMDTVGRILKFNDEFKLKRIFIDDGGVGGGVTDLLIEKLGRKVVGLNNAKRSVDKDGTKRGILKEDLYSNALVLMEAGKLELISDLVLLKSLKSIVFEYTSEKNLKIHGIYSHATEGMVRALWCIKDRGLKAYIR